MATNFDVCIFPLVVFALIFICCANTLKAEETRFNVNSVFYMKQSDVDVHTVTKRSVNKRSADGNNSSVPNFHFKVFLCNF